MPKPDVRLYPIDIARLPWERPDGSPDGIRHKVLALDPADGSVTRILECDPGVEAGVFVHDHWEEVLLLDGSYKMGEEFHPTGTFTCKPPGIAHGPFSTDDGYTCLEWRDHHGPAMDKPTVRLYPIDVARCEWVRPRGAPEGVWERVLAEGPSGARTCLRRVEPGVDLDATEITVPLESYLLEGSRRVGEEFHPTGTFTSRSAGTVAGPVLTDDGYLSLDVGGVVA